MSKMVRRFKVYCDLDWAYEVEISKLRKDLDELEKLGATHVEIEPYMGISSAYVEISAVSERMETDEEFKSRLDEEKKRKAESYSRDMEQLRKLQEKYGIQ